MDIPVVMDWFSFSYLIMLDINIVVVYLLHYISVKRTTVEFVVP